MKYTEIKIKTTTEKLDELVEKLSFAGADGFQIDDPRELEVFSGDNTGFQWNYVDEKVFQQMSEASVTLYVQEGEELSKAAEDIISGYESERKEITDDWMQNLQGYFVPTRYGEHVVAKPCWAEYTPESGDIVIDIDPGQAFGTGSSPTTELALRLLEKYMVSETRVMDIGCGTGILGILAAKMGAKEVLCTDIDDLAVECTGINIGLNHVNEIVRVEKRNLVNGVTFTADIVAANLTVDILERLFDSFSSVLAHPCRLIASGIIKEKEEKGAEIIRRAGFIIDEELKEGEWVSFAAHRD